MNIEEFREYCLAKPGVSESFPFDETTLVFKVMDKMFSLVNLEGDVRVNLKCQPEMAIELRERYPDILPGYHMSKKHWNSVYIQHSLPDKLVLQLIDNSYNLVIDKLTLKQKKKLKRDLKR